MKFKLPMRRVYLSFFTPKRICIFLGFTLAFSLAVKLYENIVTEGAITHLKNECVSIITETVNRSAADYLSANPDFSSECFTPVLNSDGNVISYSVNSVILAEAEREIVRNVTHSLQNSNKLEVKIPIGTLTNIKYFSAKGFPVKIVAYMNPAIKSDTSSKIESVGINQSLYKVSLIADITCEIILSGAADTVRVTPNVPLVEKIIIGSVPLG